MKKFFKYLLLLLGGSLLFAASSASAAVLMVDGSVAGNMNEVLQAPVRAGAYGNDAYFAPGTWDRSLYSFTLTAKAADGVTPVPITRIDAMTVTLSSNMNATTFVFDVATIGGGLKFNVEGLGAPVINAYNQAGLNVTGSSGLVGQPVVNNDITAEDIWSITFSDLRVQDVPVSSFGGAFNISLLGDTAYADVDIVAIADGVSATGTDLMRSIIGSPVPEPSGAVLTMGAILGCAFRRRRA